MQNLMFIVAFRVNVKLCVVGDLEVHYAAILMLLAGRAVSYVLLSW